MIILTILLKILCIIGWILLGILALVVLLLLLILLCPLRYKADFKTTLNISELEISGKVSYLFGLVRFDFSLIDKKLKAILGIAWKKMTLADDDEREGATPHEEVKAEPAEKPREIIKPVESSESVKTQTVPEAKKKEEKKSAPPPDPVRREEPKRKRDGKEETSRHPRFTFDGICDRISRVIAVKDRLVAFAGNEVHRRCFSHILKRLKKFARKLLPKRFDLNGEIGFDDPALCGKIAALASMLYPTVRWAETIDFNFQESAFSLDGHISGRFRLSSLLALALPIVISRDFRTSFKDAKKLKNKIAKDKERIKGGKAA